MSPPRLLEPCSAIPFRGADDFWRVRDLLITTYPITPPGFNWDIRRWDGWRFHRADPAWNAAWEHVVRLWETRRGQLVGAVHAEADGDAHLQVHPRYRHIEADMLAWAEGHLASTPADGLAPQLTIPVFEYDSSRHRLLEQRGYERSTPGGFTRRLRLGNEPRSAPAMAKGYVLRTTRPGEDRDCERIADILNAAFRRDFHTADEIRVFTTHSPSFRHDLDLVAQAPDGAFASYVGVTHDTANQCGIFEPVCTHPNHQRRGLARALMLEGLRRLRTLGAIDALLGTGDAVAANRFYESVGFDEAYKWHDWRRVCVP